MLQRMPSIAKRGCEKVAQNSKWVSRNVEGLAKVKGDSSYIFGEGPALENNRSKTTECPIKGKFEVRS